MRFHSSEVVGTKLSAENERTHSTENVAIMSISDRCYKPSNRCESQHRERGANVKKHYTQILLGTNADILAKVLNCAQ